MAADCARWVSRHADTVGRFAQAKYQRLCLDACAVRHLRSGQDLREGLHLSATADAHGLEPQVTLREVVAVRDNLVGIGGYAEGVGTGYSKGVFGRGIYAKGVCAKGMRKELGRGGRVSGKRVRVSLLGRVLGRVFGRVRVRVLGRGMGVRVG